MSKRRNDPSVSEIRVCCDRHLDQKVVGKGLAAALDERKDNLVTPAPKKEPAALLSMAAAKIPQPVNLKMAVIAKRLWKPGRVLKVRLIGRPSAVVGDHIEYYATSWSDYANVTFKMIKNGPADIRVAFNPAGGSWSYIGTDAKVIAASKPTMNYGWLTGDTEEAEFSRVILHEFGHALGAIHEHNHPEAGIPWNRLAVYQYYKQTQGWTREDVDAQVFSAYAVSHVNSSVYDRRSIMHYAIPAQLLLSGSTPVGWNRELSSRDKSFIASQYPA